MHLPDTCWVTTTEEAPFTIKAASPSWFELWHLDASAVGKPISILNKPGSDLEASALLMLNYHRNGGAKMHCTNGRDDGVVIGHDVKLEKTAGGLLATSSSIAVCKPLSPRGSPDSVVPRDAEVFGTTGVSTTGFTDSLAVGKKRRSSGRDDEFFGDDDAELLPASKVTLFSVPLFKPGARLSPRDLEVFDASEPTTIPAPPAVERLPSARDQEYFDDGVEALEAGKLAASWLLPSPEPIFAAIRPGGRPGARDLEVFGTAETPDFMVLPAKAAKILSGRSNEYFCDVD